MPKQREILLYTIQKHSQREKKDQFFCPELVFESHKTQYQPHASLGFFMTNICCLFFLEKNRRRETLYLPCTHSPSRNDHIDMIPA